MVLAAPSFAAGWELSEIKDTTAESVGYIFHTSAVGTRTILGSSGKYAASIRLICTAPTLYQGGYVYNPLIAIFWDKMDEVKEQTPTLEVDKKLIVGHRWSAMGNLLVREITDTQQLITEMVNGKALRVSWVGSDTSRREAIFDLRGFGKQISKFNEVCGLDR